MSGRKKCTKLERAYVDLSAMSAVGEPIAHVQLAV